MSKYLIEHHPLDDPDESLMMREKTNPGSLSMIQKRYIAESMAVNITESSPVVSCAEVIARLAEVHVYQLNTQFKDQANRYHDNPVELIREETKRSKNRKIKYYGNIAAAHGRLEELSTQIVSEATPAETFKELVWQLAFGAVFLVLAYYNFSTGAVVNFLTGMFTSESFITVLVMGAMLVGLFLGFYAVCAIVFGGCILLVGLLDFFPGQITFIISGVLFLIALFCLLLAFISIHEIIRYKPLAEEEHRKNQELIEEKQTLIRELNEYSDTMLAKLEIMKKKYMDGQIKFHGLMKCYIGGTYSFAAIKDIFSFLTRYYRGMRR